MTVGCNRGRKREGKRVRALAGRRKQDIKKLCTRRNIYALGKTIKNPFNLIVRLEFMIVEAEKENEGELV